MNIKIASKEDKTEWLRLRLALWPEVSTALHEKEIDAMIFNPERFAAFLAYNSSDQMIGFLEVSTHELIDEGCDIKQIGYIEGWYVDPGYRRKGVGAELVSKAEQWVEKQGLKAIAVDTNLENDISQKAYQALGYQEVDRLILYKKAL